MKISACYIVKDCAKDFERSLKSLSDSVDEIVVVDTGSSDDTVAVAEKFGARIFHEAWADDFSVPRNVALANATGDWILFLDSDEFFAKDTGKNLRFVVERAEEAKQQGVLVRIVNVDSSGAFFKIINVNFVLRIFKNTRGLRYVGRIHEELTPAPSEVTFVPPKLLAIFHTGYSSQINRAKAERNLRILRAELDETDNPARIYGYLAETYAGLKNHTEAEKFARLDLDADTSATRSYRILLTILAQNPARANERLAIAQKAADKFPALPEFSAELGEAYAALGDYARAYELLNDALKKFKTYRGIEPTTFTAATADYVKQRAASWANKF